MAYHDSPLIWKKHLEEGFREDGWPWDWTSFSLGEMRQSGAVTGAIIAKEAGIWAADGLCAAAELFAQENKISFKIEKKIKNKNEFQNQQVLCVWEGDAQFLLALERPFLNLAAYTSGVATHANTLKKIVEESIQIRVCMTRKTLPGYRDLLVGAVIAGGAYPHRISLAGGVLIKENHITLYGGVRDAIRRVRAASPHALKIEIEVTNLEELKQSLEEKIDGVLLDNFSSEQVREAVKIIKSNQSPPFVEVSGGINETNLSKYCIHGVDVISIGSLTHSVKNIDLSFILRK